MDWSAAKQSLDEDRDAMILSGSAWVRARGMKLEADNIVFFRKTREVYAEGNIRVRTGESEIAAEVAYVDVINDTGYLVDATVHVSVAPKDLDLSGGRGKHDYGIRNGGAPGNHSGIHRPQEKAFHHEPSAEQPDQAGVTSILRRTRDQYGVYTDVVNDPQARTSLVFRADKLVKLGKLHYMTEEGFITNDDMVHPMYGVKASQVDFYMSEVDDPNAPGKKTLVPQRVVAKGAKIQILGVNLFPFPTISYDLKKKSTFYQVHGGHSQRWGYYGLTRIGYSLGGHPDWLIDPTHVYFDLDERLRRGPAAGFEVDWATGSRPLDVPGEASSSERGRGHLRAYGMDEIQTPQGDDLDRAQGNLERRIQPKIDGFTRRHNYADLLFIRRRQLDSAFPPSFALKDYRNDFRGLVDFQQHQPIKHIAGIDNLEIDLKYKRESDRDFLLEYFQNQYYSDNQPEGLASIRKPGDNYSVELLYRGNPQDFDGAPPRDPVNYGTFTSYEPALTYSMVPTPMIYGIHMDSEIQAAHLRREFERDIYDQPGFEATRGYAKVDFSRPTKLWGMTLTPHVGTQQALYDRSRNSGNAVQQGAITYGLDATYRLYGTFSDFQNEELGINGLRHIMEPRISYRGTSSTLERPEKILDFDQIDDLQHKEQITFAIDNTFQTHRLTADGKGVRTLNFAGLDLSMSYYPRDRDQDRLLEGTALELLNVDDFVQVTDVLRFNTSIGLNARNHQLERAVYGFTLDPHSSWRFHFEERFSYGELARRIVGSDQFHLQLDYQISDRWGVTLEEIYERRTALLQHAGQQQERITVTRSYGPFDVVFVYSLDKNLGDHTFSASFKPAIAYRNLIVPSQDLLVAQGELSGEEAESPEERNYDPFDILKRRHDKKSLPKKKDLSPPTNPQDVPLPPLPSADKRVQIPSKSDNNSALGEFSKSDAKSALGEFNDPSLPAAPRKRSKVDDDDWMAPPTPASTR